MFTKYKIGTVTVTRPLDVRQCYECPAWQQTIRVEPGTYTLYAYSERARGDGHIHNGFSAKVEGVVVSANFAPRLGCHYGEDVEGKRVLGTVQEGILEVGPAYGRVSEEGNPDPRGLIVELDMTVLERKEWYPDLVVFPDAGLSYRYSIRKDATPEPRTAL